MTKSGIIALLFGFLLISLGVYLFIRNTDTLGVAQDKENILLYVEEGDVSYKLPGSVFVRATSSPVAIVTGTLVYTGIGQATILFPNNSSVVLDTYTELAVNYSEQKVTLFQTLGTTYHRVESLVTGNSYEVETPGTLAAVRGTKFAVKYDKKKKITKVAVTESKVEVSSFKQETGTSTRIVLQTSMLEEGKTAKVEHATTSPSGFTIVATTEDKEMNDWVEENKVRDNAEQDIKEQDKAPDTIRHELKQLIEQGVKEETSSERPTAVQKEETAPTTEANREETAQQPVTTDVRLPQEQAPVIRKLSEEGFFDKFSAMFMDYFYVDEKDTPCGFTLTPSARVRVVTTFATESGYPFQSATLLSFAQEIDTYCKEKTPALKTKLQGRFDVEFPYQENI